MADLGMWAVSNHFYNFLKIHNLTGRYSTSSLHLLYNRMQSMKAKEMCVVIYPHLYNSLPECV